MDIDTSIFALLADTDDDEQLPSSRQLPLHHVWADDALVNAWSAAITEFAVGEESMYFEQDSYMLMYVRVYLQYYASSGSKGPSLDREAQLLASPL